MLDLTLRFGVGALGDDGFISRHVRGLRDYQNARTAHAQDGDSAKLEFRRVENPRRKKAEQ